MKKIDVVRAWRDEEYRNSLTEEERASLPENPAGIAVVSDEALRSINGGCGCSTYYTTKYVSCTNAGEPRP